MKNSYVITVLSALLFIACTSENHLEPINKVDQKVSSLRTLDEARKIAIDAIGMLSGPETRSLIKREIADLHYVINPVTKSGDSADTLLYVFDYADNQGFAVVSANENTEPLLAVTEKGSYETAMAEDNGGFKMFMDMAEDYVTPMAIDPDTPIIPVDTTLSQMMEYRIVRDTIAIYTLNPKVTVQWGQSGIEGKYAPNHLSGCSNTAMAQIMSSFAYPSSIVINFSDTTFTQLLDWSQINKHKDKYSHYQCTANEDAHESISLLMRQLGHLNCSEYIDTDTLVATSTFAHNVRNTFIQFNYSVSEIQNYNYSILQESLDGSNVLYMRGERIVVDENGNEYTSSHGWIADGSVTYTIRNTTYWKYRYEFDWHPSDSYDTERTYLHLNWGWNGNCNGYFYLGVFDTSSGIYDNYDYPYGNNVPHADC